MSDEDPVKAALAAMENAMAVAAVAAKWHNKAAAHHVQNPENSKQSEIKKNTGSYTSTAHYDPGEQANVPKKVVKSSSNVLSRNTPAHTKAQGSKSMKKLSLQTIEPQGQYASRNMLITKEDYQAPRQEGERTVKLTEYQKKELLKQKQTVTRLKDEKSQILVRIREIASEDKETSNAIYEIEKEVQALTKTLTNLGAAAESKGKIAEKIQKAEEDSREQLHYHKVLHLMRTRLTAETKVLKSKIRTWQAEENESKKELQQLALLTSRLHNTVEVAELTLSEQQKINKTKIDWQKESMRRINIQISDLEAMQKLRKESNQRIRDTQQKAKGDLSVDAEEALVHAATSSRFKAAYLTVANASERERIQLFKETLVKLKKMTGKITAKEVLEYDKILLKHKASLPIVYSKLLEELQELQLKRQLLEDDIMFMKQVDHQPYAELLDVEIQLYKSNKSLYNAVAEETIFLKQIAMKQIRLLRSFLLKLLQNNEAASLYLDDSSLLKNIIPPYTDEQISTFFNLFENVNTEEALDSNLNVNEEILKRVELSADLLYHPAHHSNRKVNDQNKEIYEVVDSFMKLVRARVKSVADKPQ